MWGGRLGFFFFCLPATAPSTFLDGRNLLPFIQFVVQVTGQRLPAASGCAGASWPNTCAGTVFRGPATPPGARSVLQDPCQDPRLKAALLHHCTILPRDMPVCACHPAEVLLLLCRPATYVCVPAHGHWPRNPIPPWRGGNAGMIPALHPPARLSSMEDLIIRGCGFARRRTECATQAFRKGEGHAERGEGGVCARREYCVHARASVCCTYLVKDWGTCTCPGSGSPRSHVQGDTGLEWGPCLILSCCMFVLSSA